VKSTDHFTQNAVLDKSDITQDTGLCWHTAFGDWKCGFGGRDMRSDETVAEQPPTEGTAAR